MGKCLKDIREATLKADLWGLLRNPYGGREDIKDVRIGSVSEKRNSLASKRGHIKHTKQYQASQGMGNSMREIRRWSGCVDW